MPSRAASLKGEAMPEAILFDGRGDPVEPSVRSSNAGNAAMQAPAKLFLPSDYVEVTVHFKCNLHCTHCMIEGTMDWLRPELNDQLARILADNARRRQWKGLTLTGAEVTLRRDLPDLARAARKAGFRHVRIQTHGMRLADPEYCRELVDAGIDEYFISVTAADAATHDAITGVAGSFERTLQGLANLDKFERRRDADQYRHYQSQLSPAPCGGAAAQSICGGWCRWSFGCTGRCVKPTTRT